MSMEGNISGGIYNCVIGGRGPATTDPGHYDRSHERGENVVLLVTMIVDNDSNYDSSFA